MKSDFFIFFVCLTMLGITFIYATTEVDPSNGRYYNCDIAEFHPDYPKEVKQKCRELRYENSTSK